MTPKHSRSCECLLPSVLESQKKPEDGSGEITVRFECDRICSDMGPSWYRFPAIEKRTGGSHAANYFPDLPHSLVDVLWNCISSSRIGAGQDQISVFADFLE